MAAPTVNCKVIRATLLVAEAAGLDVIALKAHNGFAEADLADPDSRFSIDAMLAVWKAIGASGPGAFGLRAAQALPEGHFDVVDYVMGSSKNLGEALRHFERYFAILSTGSKHVLVEDGDVVRLERQTMPGAQTSLVHPTDFALANVVLRTRRMTGVPYRLHAMWFTHARPDDEREYRDVFDCPLYFGKDVSAIVFDRSTLEIPMAQARPELARILEQHAEGVLASLPKTDDDIRALVREAIIAGLKDGKTTLADVAKRLKTSERTLQRRLAAVGSSHAALLDETRSELARRYLGERSIAITEVSFLLGFSDASAFHRAFKRWTDRTPAEHRRQALAG